MDSDDALWCHRCCRHQPRHSQSSIVRYRSAQLLYILSLVIIIATLYLYLLSGPLNNALRNNVTRSEPAVVSADASVQSVVQTKRRIDYTVAATPAVQTSKASPPTASSQSPSVSTVLSVDQSLTSTTTAAHPLLTRSGLSPLPTASLSLLSTASSAAAISNAPSPASPQSVTTDKPDIGNYVSFYGGFADGRRLGNQMFNLAVVVYVAKLTGRQPAILKFNYTIGLDKVFDLGIERFDNLCPCYVFGEERSLLYDYHVEELADDSRAEDVRDKSIFLSGFFQSWKYTRNVERRLRNHFTFLPEIREFVDKFLADSKPPGWVAGYVRVAIHVRRGDVLNAGKVHFGYSTPDEQYFAHAMRYFVDRFDRVQFIVASNDIDWCRQKLSNLWTTLRHRVNVTFVTPRSAGKDLAVLASCEHVIMSTGTYGWWAAWLAHGITIYYADWPIIGSSLANMFRRKDYFPPTWIGMT